MRNIVIADVNVTCRCDCVENILDNTNNIIFNFKKSECTNPQVEISIVRDEEEINSVFDLTLVDKCAKYIIPSEYYLNGGTLKIRYVDDDYVGTWFEIACINRALGEYETLVLVKLDDFQYRIKIQSTKKYSDLQDEIEEYINKVEESITLQSINVTTANELVNNIKFNYEKVITTTDEFGNETEETKKYSTSYDIKYDNNDKVSMIGKVEVIWE